MINVKSSDKKDYFFRDSYLTSIHSITRLSNYSLIKNERGEHGKKY